MAKRSSDPKVAYTEVKIPVRDLPRVLGIIDPLLHGVVSVRGKFVLSRPRVYIGTGSLLLVPPAAVRHRRARQSSRTGQCGD